MAGIEEISAVKKTRINAPADLFFSGNKGMAIRLIKEGINVPKIK
ncbi:hypothetical protein ADIARSV_0896 [Arcticibacter svalbardensis MN12-7]|uniref:Uncharacterized protein n=1 Tax=Arcticibacter svalbardensis MN12-7 TaxID=1150600 RepID=R9GW64_9SPHI|nr:hypothetical protein ADIARSV_0896 [Arcticibacter svalbardensis MN12-7]